MSDNVVIALIGSSATVLVSLLGVAVSVFNGRRIRAVEEKATQISAATDGTLHALTSQKDVLAAELSGLKAQLEAAIHSGQLAASAASQAATDVRVAQASFPPDKETP